MDGSRADLELQVTSYRVGRGLCMYLVVRAVSRGDGCRTLILLTIEDGQPEPSLSKAHVTPVVPIGLYVRSRTADGTTGMSPASLTQGGGGVMPPPELL